MSGTLFTNDPIDGAIPLFGSIPASNLTSGKSGVGQTYTDSDWVRAIRHGVKPNGHVIIFMYTSTLSDRDLGDLLAYLKQIPPVDTDSSTIHYGPIIPIFPALGMFTPAAESIDHNAPHPADQPPAPQLDTADIFLQFAPSATATGSPTLLRIGSRKSLSAHSTPVFYRMEDSLSLVTAAILQ